MCMRYSTLLIGIVRTFLLHYFAIIFLLSLQTSILTQEHLAKKWGLTELLKWNNFPHGLCPLKTLKWPKEQIGIGEE